MSLDGAYPQEGAATAAGLPDSLPSGPGSDGGRVPWGPRDVLKLTGLVIVLIIVCMAVFEGVIHSLGLESGAGGQASPVAEFGSDIVFYGAILLAIFGYFRLKKFRISLPLLGFRRTVIWKAVLWTLLIFFLDAVASAVWIHFVKQPKLPVKREFGATILGVSLAFMGVAVLPPLVEEVFFRGVIYQGFARRFGFWGGALASASLFMIFHVDPRVFGRIFVSGLLFAFLFYRTRSLWPSIVCHFILNSLAVIALFAG